MFSAGYLLIKPVTRPAHTSTLLLPDVVVSASDCICPQFPGPYAIEWCHSSDEDRKKLLTAVGMPEAQHDDAIAWATASIGDVYGWPGVFYTVEEARAARSRFFPSAQSVRLIGLGLLESLAADFVRDATPPLSPAGFAPNGESGSLESVREGRPLAPGGQPLGFEPLNVFFGAIDHSWLCNGLERHCTVALETRPSANGLLSSAGEALRCCTEIERDEVGAEPGPWYPLLLTEY